MKEKVEDDFGTECVGFFGDIFSILFLIFSIFLVVLFRVIFMRYWLCQKLYIIFWCCFKNGIDYGTK